MGIWKKRKDEHKCSICTYFDNIDGERFSIEQCFLDPHHLIWLKIVNPGEVNELMIDRKMAAKLALKLAAFAETGEI